MSRHICSIVDLLLCTKVILELDSATNLNRSKSESKVAVQSIVWKLLDHIKTNPPQRGSFADLLLKAKDPKTGKPLSDELMFPEIAALFFAGIDTTGHTGTFIL